MSFCHDKYTDRVYFNLRILRRLCTGAAPLTEYMTKQRKLLYIGAEKCKGIVHLSCLHCGKTAHMEQEDAAACCAQGLEFEPESTLSYPDDYPEPGAEITVTGTFDSYKEEVDGNTCIYLVLRNVLVANVIEPGARLHPL